MKVHFSMYGLCCSTRFRQRSTRSSKAFLKKSGESFYRNSITSSLHSNLKLLDEYGVKFLENIVTEDDTPLSLYSPESKRESSEWRLPHESAARKLLCGTGHGRKFMLCVLGLKRHHQCRFSRERIHNEWCLLF